MGNRIKNGTETLRPPSRFSSFSSSESELFADQLHGVELLAARTGRLVLYLPSVTPEFLGLGVRAIAEMTVGGRRLEDRIFQTETLDDRRRPQVEELLDAAGDLAVGHCGNRCGAFRAVGVDIDRQWLGDADGIRQFDEYFVRDARRDHVLGDMAGGVCGRTVDFRGVLARKGAAAMGAALPDSRYTEWILGQPYYGVYYGYAALPMEPDHLTYLTSDLLDACTVYNYETGKTGPIYDLAKGAGKDPYELFLSGSVSLLTIENPNADTDRELVIFRDSFGSSLAPLLVPGYAKVTLADIRYLPSSQMGKYLTFTDQDVLFLYSAPVLNNSETLK